MISSENSRHYWKSNSLYPLCTLDQLHIRFNAYIETIIGASVSPLEIFHVSGKATAHSRRWYIHTWTL